MEEFKRLVKIVERLRGPGGCPWDRKQKISNYKNYLLEEVYELIDSINKRDTAGVEEELGDVLLLVVMLAQMYKEKGKFDIKKVVKRISDKLVSRHPHVFSDKRLKSASAVIRHWVKSKAEEKKRRSIVERLPKAAPALVKSSILFKELKYTGYLDKGLIHPRLQKTAQNSARGNSIFGDSFDGSVDLSRLPKKKLASALLYISYLCFKKKFNPEELLNEEILRTASGFRYGQARRNSGNK